MVFSKWYFLNVFGKKYTCMLHLPVLFQFFRFCQCLLFVIICFPSCIAFYT